VAVLGVVGAAIVYAILVRPHLMRMTSQSMAPTIQVGDRLLVSANVRTIERGDVVVFRSPVAPDRSHIFRVIAVPGDRLAIVDGVVQVNGKVLDEPYVAPENRDHQNHGPLQLAPSEYFLMGDNRRNAADSRYVGAIARGAIWGQWVHW
jgi:signal peptidase I